MTNSGKTNFGLQPSSGKGSEKAGAQPIPSKTVTTAPPSSGGSGGKK